MHMLAHDREIEIDFGKDHAAISKRYIGMNGTDLVQFVL